MEAMYDYGRKSEPKRQFLWLPTRLYSERKGRKVWKWLCARDVYRMSRK